MKLYGITAVSSQSPNCLNRARNEREATTYISKYLQNKTQTQLILDQQLKKQSSQLQEHQTHRIQKLNN